MMHTLALSTINLCTKFEDSSFSHSKDMTEDTGVTWGS